MKRIAEKVITVAQICITLIFVLTTVLYIYGIIPAEENTNKVLIIIMSVLAAAYLALSAYLLYVNFSERVNVKRILLYYDSDGETRASHKVVDNIVAACAKQVEGVKVRRTKIRADGKQGLSATVCVRTSCDDVPNALAKLRALLVLNLQNKLNLTFTSINFEIEKFVTNVEVENSTQGNTEQTAEVTDTTVAATEVVTQAEIVHLPDSADVGTAENATITPTDQPLDYTIEEDPKDD